jgi:hypothetical protein
MRIKIEIVTGYSTYSSMSWTKEDQDQHATDPDFQNEDDQKYAKQMEEIRQAEDDDKNGIAYDLMIGGSCQDCMMIEPYFSRIEVSYPDGEHKDEDIRPDDEVSNNWKDLSEFYEDKIIDPKNLVLILRADHMKRGLFGAEVESDKPFNINYLSVMDGEITYGTHPVEYVDGGEGYDSETQIYCDTDGEDH